MGQSRSSRSVVGRRRHLSVVKASSLAILWIAVVSWSYSPGAIDRAQGGGASADIPDLVRMPSELAGTRPSARGYHAMAYDSESDLVVLFGGWTKAENGETWTYDTNTNIWTQQNSSVSPPARDSHAMAYDRESDRVILFGGDTGSGPVDNDTWAYDLNADTWTDMRPPSSPTPRIAPQMAYDAAVDRTILFGGHDGSFYGDTWAYDYNSNAWTRMTTTGSPPVRAFQALVYDSDSQLVVMFGGQTEPGGLTTLGDTWTFDAMTATWTDTTPSLAPSPRAWCGVAYDSVSRRAFLFGGSAGAETWAYDATANRWSKVNSGANPSPRAQTAMGYDSESERSVLFGGIWPVGLVTDPTLAYDRETWILDGRNGSWKMVDPESTPPPPPPPLNPIVYAGVGAGVAAVLGLVLLRRRKRKG